MEPVLDPRRVGTLGPTRSMPTRDFLEASTDLAIPQPWRFSGLVVAASTMLGIAGAPGCRLAQHPGQPSRLMDDVGTSGNVREDVQLHELRQRAIDTCWYAGSRLDPFDQPLLALLEASACCRQGRYNEDSCRSVVRRELEVVYQWASDALGARERVRAEAAFHAAELAAGTACSVCGMPAIELLQLVAANPEWHDCRESDDSLFLTFQEAADCVRREDEFSMDERTVLWTRAEELSAQAQATCGRWIRACNDAHWFLEEPSSREGVAPPVLVPREEVTAAYSRALHAWLDLLGIPPVRSR